MYVIDLFTAETPHGKSLWTKQNVLYIIHFFPFFQIPKIQICHMVESEHSKVIERRQQLISTDVPESEQSSGDGFNDNCVDNLDEDDESGLGEAGMKTSVTQS